MTISGLRLRAPKYPQRLWRVRQSISGCGSKCVKPATMRSLLSQRTLRVHLSTSTMIWRQRASSIWPGPQRRRSEEGRGPLGGSGAAIGFRANGTPSRDRHLSRWLQSNSGLEIDYRSPDFNLRISEQARAHGGRDSGWRRRSSEGKLCRVSPSDDTGSRKADQKDRNIACRGLETSGTGAQGRDGSGLNSFPDRLVNTV